MGVGQDHCGPRTTFSLLIRASPSTSVLPQGGALKAGLQSLEGCSTLLDPGFHNNHPHPAPPARAQVTLAITEPLDLQSLNCFVS